MAEDDFFGHRDKNVASGFTRPRPQPRATAVGLGGREHRSGAEDSRNRPSRHGWTAPATGKQRDELQVPRNRDRDGLPARRQDRCGASRWVFATTGSRSSVCKDEHWQMTGGRIMIDADACPVKAEAETGRDHALGMRMVLVSNGGIRPSANPSGRAACMSHRRPGRG
jgi:hypothetical protein